MSEVGVTVFSCKDVRGPLLGALCRAAQASGFECFTRSQTLLVWRAADRRRVSEGLSSADGFCLFREDPAASAQGVAITPKRLYFEGCSDVPSSVPEVVLLGAPGRNQPAASDRIKGCLQLGSELASKTPGMDANPWPVNRVRTGLQRKTEVVVGGNATVPAGGSMGRVLTGSGFFRVPKDFEISLVAEGEPSTRVLNYAAKLENAMRRTRSGGRVRVLRVQEATDFIGRLEAAPEGPLVDGRVLLFCVRDRKGKPLSAFAKNMMERADRLGLPYRLFSEDNPAPDWSALDQLPSLLLAAGGAPFRLKLPWGNQSKPPFILGVDLGHPLARRESWVVMSLLGGSGLHRCSWRRRQPRDETIRSASLKKGLAWVRKQLDERDPSGSRGVLVVRDGRLHKGESIESYRSALGRAFTFVEFAKRRNPVMFSYGDKPQPVAGGTECYLEGSNTPYIAPVSPRLKCDLTRVFKVCAQPEWDGLGLGSDAIAEVLIGLSYSPGLGLQPHALPGPIYWADGIAAIGDLNHQFCGQKIQQE